MVDPQRGWRPHRRQAHRHAHDAVRSPVAGIKQIYEQWSAEGAEFLTDPKDHGGEIRAYVRDPDGHLIEIGQTTGLLE